MAYITKQKKQSDEYAFLPTSLNILGTFSKIDIKGKTYILSLCLPVRKDDTNEGVVF